MGIVPSHKVIITSNLCLTLILLNPRAPSPSVHSTFILLLSYLYLNFTLLNLTKSQSTIAIIVMCLHLTSILLLSGLHLTLILLNPLGPFSSSYSTFILVLSYLHLNSILHESYPILGHYPHHCNLPSSYFYLTCI